MYVKLIEGKPHIANMPDEEAREKGYKLAVFSDRPIAEENYHPESYWTEETESVTQHWNIVQNPDLDIDDAELLDILMGVTE